MKSLKTLLSVSALAVAFSAGFVMEDASAAQRDKKAKKIEKAMNSITFDCQDGLANIGMNGEGNLIRFESPLTYDHVGVGAFSEGYVVAWTSPVFGPITIHDVEGFVGGTGSGFGPPAFVPGGNFTVRYSLDGTVKLTQVITPDCPQRKLVLEQEVQNCTGGLDPICSGGGVNMLDVCIARQVDFDVDTGDGQGFVRSPGAGFINDHAASQDAYIAWNNKGDGAAEGFEAHSMHLSILNPQRGPVFSVAKVTNQILDTGCPAVSEQGIDSPRLRRDDGGRIEATTPTLGPGESVSLLLEYKRD